MAFLKETVLLKKMACFEEMAVSGKMEVFQKRILWGLVGIVVLVLLYTFGILPLVEAKKKAEEEILLKSRALLRYEDYLGTARSSKRNWIEP
jgi:hypothetical protein